MIAGNVPATKPGKISLLVPSSGAVVLLTAWGARDCWAIIDITDSSKFEGFSGPGTIFLLLPHVKKPICSALTFDSQSEIPGVLVSVIAFPTPPVPAEPGTAPENLQKALTGAKTFYTQNNQTYSGLDATTFAGIDTGLTVIAGNVSSTKSNVISLLVPSSGTVARLAAWDGSHTCLAIIDITDSSTLEGFGCPERSTYRCPMRRRPRVRRSPSTPEASPQAHWSARPGFRRPDPLAPGRVMARRSRRSRLDSFASCPLEREFVGWLPDPDPAVGDTQEVAVADCHSWPPQSRERTSSNQP